MARISKLTRDVPFNIRMSNAGSIWFWNKLKKRKTLNIKFHNKPNTATRNKFRNRFFKWSQTFKQYYKKDPNDRDVAFAKMITGNQKQTK